MTEILLGKGVKWNKQTQFKIIMSKKSKMYVINRKFKCFDFLWNENCHISLVVAAAHEIFIFIPLDVNKYCIDRKKNSR
jgi:hypothetical protein